jgi:multidrug/hemolysin transport system permease protein
MNALLQMAGRNLRIFFRSRSALLLTLLPLPILFLLYPLLLVDLHAAAAYDFTPDIHAARWLADSWIAAGVPVVLSFTAALGALGVLPGDREDRRMRDFGVSPLGGAQRAGGYALAAVYAGILTAMFAYTILQVSIHLIYNLVPDLREILFGAGYTLLGAVHASAFGLLLASLLYSGGAFAAVGAASAALAGFMSGAFIPAGLLPSEIRMVIQALPASQAVSLIRQTLTQRATAQVFATAGAADVSGYQAYFGIRAMFQDRTIEPFWILVILAATTVVLLVIALPLVARNRRRD